MAHYQGIILELVDEAGDSSISVSVHESITVTESVACEVSADPNKHASTHDALTITENVSVSVSALAGSPHDGITVTEDVDVYLYKDPSHTWCLGATAIFTGDGDTIEEAWAGGRSALRHDLTSATITRDISVYDAVTITESTVVSIPSGLSPETYDTITVTENVSVEVSGLEIDIYDNINVTEFTACEGESEPPINVSQFDTITITESVSVKVSDLQVSVYENITITDIFPSGTININVHEDITITEHVFGYVGNDVRFYATTIPIEISMLQSEVLVLVEVATSEIELTSLSATYPLYGRMAQPIITGSKPKVICEASSTRIDCEGRTTKILMSGY